MEGIANFIIPMLKNQTVNTNSHMFLLHKLKAPKTEPSFLADFSPKTKYFSLYAANPPTPTSHLASITTDFTSLRPFSFHVTKYYFLQLGLLLWKHGLRAS